jgi:hypothetical protein
MEKLENWSDGKTGVMERRKEKKGYRNESSLIRSTPLPQYSITPCLQHSNTPIIQGLIKMAQRSPGSTNNEERRRSLMGKKSILIMFFIAIVAFFAGMVTSERSWAQETAKSTPAKGEDGWRTFIALYGWLAALQGYAEGKGGNKVDINIDFGDTIDLLSEIKFVLLGRIEIEKGRWGFIYDGAYVKLGGSDNISGIRDTRFPILVPPTVTITGNVEMTMETSIMQAALSYDVYRSAKFVGKKPELTIEAMAGARYTYLRTRLELAAAGPLIGIQKTIDESKNWTDPIVGGRLLWNPHKNWQVNFEADIGGFGAGSDFSSNLNLGVFYRVTDWLLLWGGYRGLYTNYDKNHFIFNTWLHGPYLGLGFEF